MSPGLYGQQTGGRLKTATFLAWAEYDRDRGNDGQPKGDNKKVSGLVQDNDVKNKAIQEWAKRTWRKGREQTEAGVNK